MSKQLTTTIAVAVVLSACGSDSSESIDTASLETTSQVTAPTIGSAEAATTSAPPTTEAPSTTAAPTSIDEPQPSSTQAEQVTSSAPTSTPPSSSEAPSTVESPVQEALDQAPIWPAADVVFDTPQAAADDFLSNVLGVGVLGEFRPIDPRSGQIEVRSNADAPPGTTFPRALLQLRQLRPTDGWYVTSATSEGASISFPSAGAEVPAGPLTVEGEARGFESTINVFAFAAGPNFSALDDIDAVLTSGGAFGQTEPFSATIDLSQLSPGDVTTILVRGDVGLSDDPGEFAAVPVVIAPAS